MSKIKIKIYNQTADEAGDIELSEKVFGVKANEALIHQAVVAQMANERQVLAHTKGRSDVRGGGRKPWRQKGTGRARQGSIRAPQWRGGGIVFGPLKTRNFSLNINKKMRQKAVFMVLSDKVANNSLVVLDKVGLEEFKTKTFNAILNNIENKILNSADKAKKQRRSFLVINNAKNEKVKYSGRNLEGVKILNEENLNIVDLLKYKNIILTVNEIKKLEETYA